MESIPPRDGAQDAEKNELKPPFWQRGRLWLKECWCIPPQGNAEFVCAMEDVLEVYQRQFGDNEVLVCPGRNQQTAGEGNATAAPAPPPIGSRVSGNGTSSQSTLLNQKGKGGEVWIGRLGF